MKRYQSYKLEPELWIGEIPFHWKKSRVGRHFKIERGRVISKEEIQDNLGEYPVYSSQTSNNGELGRISTYDFDGEYVTWTTDGEKTGTCFYRTGKFNTTNVCGMLSLRETTPYSLKFLNYYLNQVTRPYVRLDINPKLMNNMMSEIPLIIPPLQEQNQIVQFLDEKTELIDKLISTKESKITLLKEQRTSLINQIVTKGLNPDVKMKDSGVEWIGEIPEHWEVLKISYFGTVTLGKMLTSDEKEGFELKPYLRSQNIQKEKVDISDIKEMWFNEQELIKLRLLSGDLLLNEGGDVGRTCIWNNEIEECYIQNSVNRLRFSNDLQEYFLLLSNIYHYVGYYDSIVNRVSIPHLTKEKLESVKFIRPPFSEQKQIVDFLNSKTKEIDDLVSLEQRKIDTLKEYRQSLISEVVTGKIKVTTD